MNTITRLAAAPALGFAAMSCAFAARAAEGEAWEWMVVPYVWAVDISADLDTRFPRVSGSADVTFSDIVDKLDGAFQMHTEGQGDRFGAFADFTYLGVSDSNNDRPRLHTESTLDTLLVEVAAVWSPGDVRFRGVDVFAGLRYLDIDLTTNLIPTNPVLGRVSVDGGDSFNDFMLGVRYTWALSERWGLTLRGDGSFGDTEGTWNASAMAHYRTRSGAWFLGYRYLEVEIENGNNNLEITMSGPGLGYGFRF
ncbi:MAG TPA: hypothetical protein VIT62_03855 [Lysobacter sp.]